VSRLIFVPLVIGICIFSRVSPLDAGFGHHYYRGGYGVPVQAVPMQTYAYPVDNSQFTPAAQTQPAAQAAPQAQMQALQTQMDTVKQDLLRRIGDLANKLVPDLGGGDSGTAGGDAGIATLISLRKIAENLSKGGLIPGVKLTVEVKNEKVDQVLKEIAGLKDDIKQLRTDGFGRDSLLVKTLQQINENLNKSEKPAGDGTLPKELNDALQKTFTGEQLKKVQALLQDEIKNPK